MKTFYEGRVEPAHIDNLGHMNVRVYGMKAAAATHALAATLGLDTQSLDGMGALVTVNDNHTRYYREQLEGASLAVRGGVLSADADALELYFELFNVENGDLSATFRNMASLKRRDDRAPLPIPENVVAAAISLKVDQPDHGKPRSLSLGPMRSDITLANALELEIPTRLAPYDIGAEACDTEGYLDLSDGKTLAWISLPIKQDGPPPDPDRPRRLGIATIESRQVIYDYPQLGDRLVTHTTNVEVTEKLVQFRNWTFNEASGDLVAIEATTGLGFDLEKRRSAAFPPNMRAALEKHSHPELA